MRASYPGPAGDPSVLLLGAGHTNLVAVPALRRAFPQVRITLIDASARATYSGMFPGRLAGHYPLEALQVDLPAFCARQGIAFGQGRIAGLDPQRRHVEFEGAGATGYDPAALDVGSHGAMPEIPRFADHAVPITPLCGLVARLAGTGASGPFAMIGGGVAGVEVALALSHAGGRAVTLIEKGPHVAAALGPPARSRLTEALARAGVVVRTGAQVTAIQAGTVVLRDGTRIASAVTVGIAGARAHGWMGRRLPVDPAGFVRVTPELQVEGHPGVFAVGDCAAMMHTPRPEAGVFAVLQAPVLAANLIAAATGGARRRYDPQRDYLKIISLGARTATGRSVRRVAQSGRMWSMRRTGSACG